MPLDPTVEVMLQQMAEAQGPALNEMSPPDAREMYRTLNAASAKPEVASVEDTTAGEIPIRVYKVSEHGEQPVIVFFHGGGWVIGDLETHDGACRQLALAAQCTVVAVDYRLAPEHPFPAAIDDSFEVTKWVAENAGSLGVDANKLCVAGDSAGGNLAACVCLKARDATGPAIGFQLLIYPATDARMNTESYEANKDGYMLTRDGMQWFWDHYTGGQQVDNPLASPLLAPDLSGLPPACIITAEYDPLRDEGEAYGRALQAAGVTTNTVRFDGMIHGFFAMTDILEGSRKAMDLAAAELRQVFGN
jgi:acetyl esterase